MAFYHDNQGSIIASYIIETNKTDNNHYEVGYSTISGERIGSIFIDNLNKRVTSNSFMKLNSGQATIDCVTAAYSRYGWASLWVFIQTAFIPETAVGIAAFCAGRNS